MNIEEYRLKIEASEQKVEKCKKTIERHQAQLEKKAKQLREMGIDPETADKYSYARSGNREAYSLLCDYGYKKEGIKGATQKLQDAERICAGWKEKLDLEINKEKIIQDMAPQVIKDFLQDWKEKAFEWYKLRHASFVEFKAELREEEREARFEALKTLPEYAALRERLGDKLYENDYYINNAYPGKPMEDFLSKRALDYRSRQKRIAEFADKVILKMCEFRDEGSRLKWLDSALEQEKKSKLFVLVTQITGITGPITDARYLDINAGEINGVILGEKGAAKVQSFSAGGWNVQCFHHRCRVDDVSDRFKGDPAPFIKNGSDERICTYQFPRFEGGDDDVARDYGLEVVGSNKDDTVVKGQYRDIRAFADQYLGYQLVPEYLKDVGEEKTPLDEVIGRCKDISEKRGSAEPKGRDSEMEL